MPQIPNFIEVYKNVLDDQVCEEFINYFNEAKLLGLTMNRQQAENDVSSLNKDDSMVFIEPLPDEVPLKHISLSLTNKFNNAFWGVAYKDYIKKYSILETVAPHANYNIKIQKTKPGQGYHLWHAESDSRESSTRLLAWTGYLNDDFEAGETEFLYQQYRYKPSKGDIVIFPAAFTHTHRGNPPIGGTKYIITGWVEF